MKKQNLQIGKSFKVEVTWYDTCPVPPRDVKHEGEVIGWRDSQIIVSVKGYAVIRFWKKNGLEVGNKDYSRRGFWIDVEAITANPAPGVTVTFDE
jgi:hypothetical protein